MKNIITTMFILLLFQWGIGQGVGIGTNTPDSSAVLDVSSTSKGMLMPRMTTAQRDAIASPTSGLQILNLDDFCLDIYDGANWIKHCGLKITGQDTLQPFWVQRAALPGGSRYDAVSFTIGDAAYMGTGNSASMFKNDLWAYYPLTDTWAQKANLPASPRIKATGFAIGGAVQKGYLGTGFDTAFVERNDFWEFDPMLNAWTQKASLPDGRSSALGFSLQDKGYIGTGFNAPGADMYEYDPVTDTWTAKNSIPDVFSLYDAVAIEDDSVAYIGTGRLNYSSSTKKFWRFDPTGGGTWTVLSDFPGAARYDGVVSGDIVGLGIGDTLQSFRNDMWQYEPDADSWKQIPAYTGSGRVGATGFDVSGRYFVCGGSTIYSYSDMWEFVADSTGPIYTSSQDLEGVYAVNDGIWTKDQSALFPSSSMSKIKLGSTVTDRKLVFGESGDNDHQYLGFRIHENHLKYQVNSPNANHIFFAGSSATSSNELLRIQGNGNIGIGTTTPDRILQVQTGNNAYGLSHTNDTVELVTYIDNAYGGWIGTSTQHPMNLYAGDGSNQFTLLPNGNIGINTALPYYKLHLTGNSLFNGNVGIGAGPANRLDVMHGAPRQEVHPTNRPLYVTGDLGAESDGIEFRHGNGTQGIGFGFNTIYATGRHVDQDLGMTARGTTGALFFKTNGTERLRINGSGQVMIGTSNPATDHLLSVGGKIAAEEILVDLEADWPDYVFEKEYALPSLDALKAFIDHRGHLPGVPSATEVKENGIHLGEMNVVLLEKIEELTLYILAQEERIRNLESRMDPKQ